MLLSKSKFKKVIISSRPTTNTTKIGSHNWGILSLWAKVGGKNNNHNATTKLIKLLALILLKTDNHFGLDLILYLSDISVTS